MRPPLKWAGGQRWQEELEKVIKTAASGAVLVGGDGFGPWEDQEMRACRSTSSRNASTIPSTA